MNKIVLFLAIGALSVHLHGQQLNLDVSGVENTGGNHRDFRSFVREGNRHFNAQRADDAERAYRHALNIDDRSDIASFNLGNAFYRQERFEEAGVEFEKVAASAADNFSRARAYHNLGNSLLQQQKLEESIEAYKQALRNNPDDFDTKYNLSYAMNLLQNQDEQDPQCNQDQCDNNQDKQDNEDGDSQQEPQEQEGDDQNQQQQQQQPQQISPEDAQRMLEAIAQDEKELLEKLQQRERTSNRNIERNW